MISMILKKQIHLFVLFVLFAGLPLFATGPRLKQKLVVSVEKEIYALELAPYFSGEVTNNGLVSEIVSKAFEAGNSEAGITILPLQSMVKYYLTQEKPLGVMGHPLGLSEKQMSSLEAIPLYVTQEHFYYYKPHHKAALQYNGKLSSLQGLTYGALKGEDTTLYKQSGISVKKGRAPFLLKKLVKGKVDFVSLSEESAQWFMKNRFSGEQNNFASMQGKSSDLVIYLYMNKNNPNAKKYSKAFRRGLQTIIGNGTYRAILKKYNISDEEIDKKVKFFQKSLKG